MEGKDYSEYQLGITEAEEIFLKFQPLLRKYSRIYNQPDEDLYSELVLAMLKCIQSFDFNADSFAKAFYQELQKQTKNKI